MRREFVGLLTLAALALAAGAPAQEQLMRVKGGHQLGETAEQFFGEGQEKDALDACTTKDFKDVDKSIRSQVKKDCNDLAETRRLAMTGKREAYQSGGDLSDMRTDTFTFDGGHLVEVDLVYSSPSAEFNYRGHSFAEILSGAKEAYGPPTSESTKQIQDVYGVPYVAHRELWVAAQAAIVITERPGPGGSTTLVAYTRAEYDRVVAAGAQKPANPLE